ncbi:MAG: metal-dependent hydrolase [Campylobacteraceae bacterium]|jgi:cytosine/adenosine deaminase-related metal-dependent hydrolase|nr:metal-dependent hydrolase [Campylobacteraceae bacterium]
MRVLLGDFVFTCNDEFNIIKNGGVCFDKKIIEVGDGAALAAKYKNAQIEKLPKNSILMPGLINSHTHLEFSANIATLKLGDFMLWLKSVIASREELQNKCNEELIKSVLSDMLKSGVTTIGAISSFGLDFDSCVKTPLHVVYFVEAIGSNPSALDALFSDFKSRYYEAKAAKNSSFTPAISIHSPYSTHPILARHALNIAKDENVPVAAHFMESIYERKWLDNESGTMGEFMKSFNPHAKPMTTAKEFLELFHDVKTLFVHAVHAKDNELEIIEKQKNAIAHCPRSNALLGTGVLDISKVRKENIALLLGTDGLSSNINLNLWDEMRAALFTHQSFFLEDLAVLLLKASTCEGAKALDLNKGKLEKGFDADIIVLNLKEIPTDISQLPLHVILQTSGAHRVFIGGEKCIF